MTSTWRSSFRIWGIGRQIPSGVLALAFVLMPAVVVTPSAQAQTLYSFTGPPDGANPSASLIQDAAGNLYGTTSSGGTSNLGTVFKLDTTGQETVLYSFRGGSDGAVPLAGLVMDALGNLYGTTSQGGTSNLGTVFKLDTTGTETVLRSFAGPPDGANPSAGLVVDAAGNLYGTTSNGGTSNFGTVFKVDTIGAETVLYSFLGFSDGAYPAGGLVLDAAGNLYGTSRSISRGHGGTVYMLDPTGTETVLHQFFAPSANGSFPSGSLIRDAAGNIYGTTSQGGTNTNTCSVGCGVVFKLDPSGAETVLYAFTGSDGAFPLAGLVMDATGNLYGTTSGGGLQNCTDSHSTPTGCGTVFALDTTGKETVVYSFPGGNGGPDGAFPDAGLILDAADNLYGTTSGGGASGFGTLFKVDPATPPDFAVSVSLLTPSTVRPGASATSTVDVTAIGGFSSSVALSCSVQPSPGLAPRCSVSPSSVTPGTTATLTVTTTGPTAGALPVSPDSGWFYALWLPLIGLVGAGVRVGAAPRRKERISTVVLACVLLAGSALEVACGGASQSRGGGSSGTPAGTYTLTVTSTSSTSVQHSTTTMLTVQ